MGNKALNRKPLESEWARPEEATNGQVTGYTGEKGFADATYPATYTLDLEKVITLHTIRILLWDKDSRQYYYSLSISNDNETWDTYYNTIEHGFNGWQVFEFAKNIKARYIRLHGKYNTKNDGFHIVEFEVHDTKPTPLPATIQVTNHKFLLEPIIDNNLFVDKLQAYINNHQLQISEQYSKLFLKLKDDAGIVEKLKVDLTDKISEFEKTILQLNLVGKSLNFQQESGKLNSLSKYWLVGSGISFILFLCLLFAFLCSDNFHFMKISEALSKSTMNKDFLNMTLTFEFISFLVLKSLLVSLSIYAIVFCAKNYKTQKHNYTINQHKAMSLFASVELLDNEKLSPNTKEQILMQATNAIFSHQHSGYNNNDSEINPNILATSIDKIKDALGK